MHPPTPSPAEPLPYHVRVLGIDYRALAVFRIAAGLLVLVDLGLRALDLSAFYTDHGILPRLARIELYELVDPSGFRYQWSLHMGSGQWFFQAGMFLLAGWFAVWLILGYRTRLATVVTWVLLYSLDHRNPMLLDSGDVLLRNLLFWSIFLPLNGRWSFDRLRHPEPVPLPNASSRYLLSAATVAILLQLCQMYWFSAIHKTHPCWLRDYTAVYFALSNDIFATPLGKALLDYPRLLQGLTLATYGMELLGPLLIFSPFRTYLFRTAVCCGFVLLHLAFGLTLAIGIFAPISMLGWILVLPEPVWDQLGRRWRRITVAPSSRFAKWYADWFRHGEQPRIHNPWWASGLVVFLFVYVVVWNVRELNLEYWAPRIMPREWNWIGRVTGLEQRWSMFSPIPSIDDGWYVMEGTLRDGTKVNLWQPGEPLPWRKPQNVAATYVGQRWRKYLDSIKLDTHAGNRLFFGNWLQRRWNSQWSGRDPRRELAELVITFQYEETPLPGEEAGDPLSTVLWTWRYEPLLDSEVE